MERTRWIVKESKSEVARMLDLLNNYSGSLEVNGVQYDTINHAKKALSGYKGPVVIVLNKQAENAAHPNSVGRVPEVKSEQMYRIKVRQYMTKPPCPEFDFHTKWNNGIPMPMRVMVGKKLAETRGMVKMELHGEPMNTSCCMVCGRTLTHPVSKLYGIGPECGGHFHINPFDSESELKAALEQVNEKVRSIRWTGWIIKSAIEEEVPI